MLCLELWAQLIKRWVGNSFPNQKNKKFFKRSPCPIPANIKGNILMPTISRPQTKWYISVLSSTFLMLSEQELLSASHFPLQRALNLVLEKTFYILSRTAAEQSTLCCWHGTDHADLYHTVLYQWAQKLSSRLEKIWNTTKRTPVTITLKGFQEKL